jgi:hypothetical protein
MRLVSHLFTNGVKMAVATSSTKEGFLAKSGRHSDLFDKMSHVVTGSDTGVKRGKPAPGNFGIMFSFFRYVVLCNPYIPCIEYFAWV